MIATRGNDKHCAKDAFLVKSRWKIYWQVTKSFFCQSYTLKFINADIFTYVTYKKLEMSFIMLVLYVSYKLQYLSLLFLFVVIGSCLILHCACLNGFFYGYKKYGSG